MEGLADIIEIKDGSATVRGEGRLRAMMDKVVCEAVLEADGDRREALFLLTKETAEAPC